MSAYTCMHAERGEKERGDGEWGEPPKDPNEVQGMSCTLWLVLCFLFSLLFIGSSIIQHINLFIWMYVVPCNFCVLFVILYFIGAAWNWAPWRQLGCSWIPSLFQVRFKWRWICWFRWPCKQPVLPSVLSWIWNMLLNSFILWINTGPSWASAFVHKASGSRKVGSCRHCTTSRFVNEERYINATI